MKPKKDNWEDEIEHLGLMRYTDFPSAMKHVKSVQRIMRTEIAKAKKETAEEIVGELEKASEKIQGGGNGRRVIIQAIESIKEKYLT